MSLSGMGITNSDFIDNMLSDLGITATITPITETTDERLNKTFTEGTPFSQTVIYVQKADEKLREKMGLMQLKETIILYRNDSTIKVGDKVTIVMGDGTYVFKIHNQIDRHGIYRVSELYYWGT
jgi:hypothetical protein